MSDSSFINDDVISRMNLSESMNEGMLWAEDKGTLPLDARRALLQLLRGPFVDAVRHKDLWNAILNNQEAIASRLNDLLLDLIIDTEAGIAFVRNAGSDTESFPKAVRAVSLTLSDTIMVLTLRHELLTSTSERAIGFSATFAFRRSKELAAASTFASESFISKAAHCPSFSIIASTSRPLWSR